MSDAPDIESLVADAEAAIAAAGTTEDITRVATQVAGKKSPLSEAHRSLGKLDPEARKQLGQRLHEARTTIDGLLDRRRTEIQSAEMKATMEADLLDLSEFIPAPAATPAIRGHLHLVSRTRDELEDVFVGMGFEVAEGPDIETDWYNFGALNIPPAHPARGMWDTFYLNLGAPESTLLRTHTSPVQIHLMEAAVRSDGLPIHAVMPGRCYRRDTPDASHLPVFHQIEGLVVDKGITFADLAGTIEVFTSAYFGPDIHSRLRPAYFPFTEPSAEFEVTCTICRGKRLSHLLPDRLDRARRLRDGGPGGVRGGRHRHDQWTGFAFGFGIDRSAQMRHQIADMRALNENDMRFLRQF